MIERLVTTGMTKVVDADGLLIATMDGWNLLAIVQGKEVVPCRDQVPDPRPDAYCGATVEALVHVPSVRTLFVVGLDKEDSIARLSKQVEDRDKTIAKAAEELAAARAAVEGHAEVVAGFNKRLADIREMRNRTADERDAIRDSSQKMEGDLAAIRESLGSKQFDSIIADCETKRSQQKG